MAHQARHGRGCMFEGPPSLQSGSLSLSLPSCQCHSCAYTCPRLCACFLAWSDFWGPRCVTFVLSATGGTCGSVCVCASWPSLAAFLSVSSSCIALAGGPGLSPVAAAPTRAACSGAEPLAVQLSHSAQPRAEGRRQGSEAAAVSRCELRRVHVLLHLPHTMCEPRACLTWA